MTESKRVLRAPETAKYNGNESLWCCPSNRVLGESVAKSERTTGEITRELERDGHLHRRRGSSRYEFPGLEVNFGTLSWSILISGSLGRE